MKAITVRRPWSWAIEVGAKTIENRKVGFPANYRGELGIHAAVGWSTRGLNDPRVCDLARRHGIDLRDLPGGGIVAVCHLADVHRAEPGCCDSEWAETSYTINGGAVISPVAHLVLERIDRLPFLIPCRGALGLWTPPPHVVAEVTA